MAASGSRWGLGVELLQRLAQFADQHHLATMTATEQAVRTEILAVEGIYRTPTQMFRKKIGRAGLDHLVFGVGVGVHDEGL